MWDKTLTFIVDYRQYLVFIAAILALRFLIVAVYKRRKSLKKRDKFIIGINNITFIAAGAWLFLITLHMIGITVREFLTSITIIAAALAIVFREYVQNGLNGMLILFGDNFEIGDYVEVNDQKGNIHDLTLMHVHLKNDEDNLVLIPNNIFAASNVINYSKNPRHFSSIDFEVRSHQSIEFARLEKTLDEALKDHLSEIRPDSMDLKVVEFREDLVHYRFRFGMKKYDHKKVKILKQLLYRNLLELLQEKKSGRN